MPFSGTGAFTLVSGNPVVTGTAISSTVQNNTMSDFANGFTNCITRDGQSPPTANLPMGNQRHTGASNATGTGEYLVYGQSLTALSTPSITTPTVTATTSVTTLALTVTGAAALNGGVGLGDAAADIITFTGTPAGQVVGGKYTPTLSNVSNVASSSLSGQAKYMRVGSVVTVSVAFVMAATATGVTATSLGITLPIASNFTTSFDAIGVANPVPSGTGSTPDVGRITSNSTSDIAIVSWGGVLNSGGQSFSAVFQYEVI